MNELPRGIFMNESTTNSKIYVILQYEWEYDDNSYHKTQSESGHIFNVAYPTRESAEKVAHRLNIELVRDMGLSDYCYDDIEDICEDSVALERELLGLETPIVCQSTLRDLFFSPINSWNISDIEKDRIASHFPNLFCTVEEIVLAEAPPIGRTLDEAIDIEQNRFKDLDI